MNLENLPFNWFDFVIPLFLLMGALRGRKHGMSEESLYMVQWLTMFFAATFTYELLGQFLASATVFTLLFSNVAMYLTVLIVIRLFFALVKRALGGKLIGSDIFGGAEYYLGMGAGMVRFTCILMTALSLINARFVTPAEAQKADNFQIENYGKVYFPSTHALQRQVFQNSFLGRQIKEHLDFLLMKPTATEDKALHQKEAVLP